MTTTFKNINDKSFSITFTTSRFTSEDVEWSDGVDHSGLNWTVEVNSSEGNLIPFLGCGGHNIEYSNTWNAKTKATFRLHKAGGAAYEKSHEFAFNCYNGGLGPSEFIKSAELTEYIDNECITIECIVEIKSITGIRQKRRKNFDAKDELSDVELLADSKSFHVSKVVLASVSPVFHAMFCSDFKEKNAEIVPLRDINAVEFDMFLQLIYQSHVDINALHVEGLLKLADRFNVDIIIDKCEQFLLSTKDVDVAEKLRFAEQYALSELQNSCIDSINTSDDLDKAITCYEEMGELTAKALLKRSQFIMRNK